MAALMISVVELLRSTQFAIKRNTTIIFTMIWSRGAKITRQAWESLCERLAIELLLLVPSCDLTHTVYILRTVSIDTIRTKQ